MLTRSGRLLTFSRPTKQKRPARPRPSIEGASRGAYEESPLASRITYIVYTTTSY